MSEELMETETSPTFDKNQTGDGDANQKPSDCMETNHVSDAQEKVDNEKLAEERKENGNNSYRQKNYVEALKLYTEAIDLCPKCAAYYTNRAAAYIMLEKYEKALEDCRQALRIDPQCTKASLREAKCHLAMGEPAAANMSYEIVLRREPDNKLARTELDQARQLQENIERTNQYLSANEFRRAVYYIDRCIEISPACRKFRIQKAECLALLRRYQESQEIVNDILRMDSMNADAVYVRGLCLYYQDQLDKAFQHFQQVLRLAPDHKKARDVYRQAKALVQKKEEGNAAFKAGNLESALSLYSEALTIDCNNILVNSKIYCNRALIFNKMHKLKEAIDDCTKAIELDEGYVRAYQRRANCYQESEMHEEAVRDFEKVCQLDNTRESKQALRNAKLELKKSKRKDYYKILDVSKDATEEEIKKAYRKRALLHHPDRHAHASDEVKKEEEKKFKEIGEAYSVLSDPKKKARYDSGQDLEEMDAHGFHDIDPNQIFQTFFGGPGGFSFSSGGGGGFPGGFSSGGGGGFPGGFSFSFG